MLHDIVAGFNAKALDGAIAAEVNATGTSMVIRAKKDLAPFTPVMTELTNAFAYGNMFKDSPMCMLTLLYVLSGDGLSEDEKIARQLLVSKLEGMAAARVGVPIDEKEWELDDAATFATADLTEHSWSLLHDKYRAVATEMARICAPVVNYRGVTDRGIHAIEVPKHVELKPDFGTVDEDEDEEGGDGDGAEESKDSEKKPESSAMLMAYALGSFTPLVPVANPVPADARARRVRRAKGGNCITVAVLVDVPGGIGSSVALVTMTTKTVAAEEALSRIPFSTMRETGLAVTPEFEGVMLTAADAASKVFHGRMVDVACAPSPFNGVLPKFGPAAMPAAVAVFLERIFGLVKMVSLSENDYNENWQVVRRSIAFGKRLLQEKQLTETGTLAVVDLELDAIQPIHFATSRSYLKTKLEMVIALVKESSSDAKKKPTLKMTQGAIVATIAKATMAALGIMPMKRKKEVYAACRALGARLKEDWDGDAGFTAFAVFSQNNMPQAGFNSDTDMVASMVKTPSEWTIVKGATWAFVEEIAKGAEIA
jgi:hypothetical protein